MNPMKDQSASSPVSPGSRLRKNRIRLAVLALSLALLLTGCAQSGSEANDTNSGATPTGCLNAAYDA